MTTYKFIKNEFYSKTYHDQDTALFLSSENEFFKKFTYNTSIENKYSLLAVRQDLESSFLPEKLNYIKYDLVCDPVNWNFLLSRPILHSISSFIGIAALNWSKIHLKASKITTNRSHSAILGILAEKDVEMFRNSYHKNRSIWEYSLKDKGVKWIE